MKDKCDAVFYTRPVIYANKSLFYVKKIKGKNVIKSD